MSLHILNKKDLKIVSASLFFLCVNLCLAQEHVIPLWDLEVPNAKVSDIQETQSYTYALIIEKVTKPSIEVYLPSKGRSIGKAVMICPGGGYGNLAYDKEGTDIAKWLNGYGIAGIVLKYRLPEDALNIVPHLSPLMDAKRGMEIIREYAEEWQIDPKKIGVMGFSAGGHLASTLGTHFEAANQPNFIALVYPVITMKKDYTHQGSRKNLLGEQPTEDLVNYYSNELQVSQSTPATFIVHCQDDKTVPVENSLQMFKALKDNGVPTQMHLYSKGGHGFSMGLNRGNLSKWSQLFIEWLNTL